MGQPSQRTCIFQYFIFQYKISCQGNTFDFHISFIFLFIFIYFLFCLYFSKKKKNINSIVKYQHYVLKFL